MGTTAEPELNLLLAPQEPVRARRILIAAIGSLIFHFLCFSFVALLPGPGPVRDTPFIVADLRKSTPLYIPRDLTQKEENKGKITRTLDVRSTPPPAPVPQAPRFRQPAPQPAPSVSVPTPAVEPPKIEASLEPPSPPPTIGKIPQVAPPPEKPKLAFEGVGAGGKVPTPNPNPNFKLPNMSVEDAARASIQPSRGGGGANIGDIDEMNSLTAPGSVPSDGPLRSPFQLLSDPMGVDFKPYLIQVVTVVRRNWLAVIPESARMGRKGRVLVQFIIDRRGGVPKLVIAESSGTSAFDRAAVAGISASNPFPPLPTGFKGDEIRLQLAFTYNVPSR